ncbi:MAG TPA: hypothetical protein VLI06_01420 [Solimonas sp.]|nr:hypothetical protein [Solimonas sp.]
MHDIDRTQMEYSPELSSFETEQYEFGQQEWSGEAYGETYGESVLTEAEETELASEMLEVTNEAELDRFLGNLLGRAARAVGSAVRSPIGQAVGGVLKGVAKKALPLAGGALGGYVGGPLGAKIGSGLASAAGSALGLEAESLEQEDREFEGAKQFVRLGADTVKQAAAAPPTADPRAVAQNAAIAAAQRHAPGLLPGGGAMPGAMRAAAGGARAGRWMRRGNKIVLYGV